MLKVAVIGVGAFGREHARVYSEVGASHVAFICDIDESRGRPIAERYGAKYVADYRELIGQVEAASITVPTESHATIDRELLKA